MVSLTRSGGQILGGEEQDYFGYGDYGGYGIGELFFGGYGGYGGYGDWHGDWRAGRCVARSSCVMQGETYVRSGCHPPIFWENLQQKVLPQPAPGTSGSHNS